MRPKATKDTRRSVLLVVASLLGFALTLAAAAYAQVESSVLEALKARVEHDLSERLGGTVSVGSLDVSLYDVTLNDVTFRTLGGNRQEARIRTVHAATDVWRWANEGAAPITELDVTGLDLTIGRSAGKAGSPTSLSKNLAAARLERARLDDATIRLVDDRGAIAKLDGVKATIAFEGSTLRYDLSATELAVRGRGLGRARLAGTMTPSALNADVLKLDAPGSHLGATARLALTSDAVLAARGTAKLRGAALASVLERAPAVMRDRMRADGADVEFTLEGGLASPGGPRVAAKVALSGARVRRNAGSPWVRLTDCKGEIEHVSENTTLRNVTLANAVTRVEGGVSLAGRGDAAFDVRGWTRDPDFLSQLATEVIGRGTLVIHRHAPRAGFDLRGTASASRLSALTGRVELDDVRLRLPPFTAPDQPFLAAHARLEIEHRAQDPGADPTTLVRFSSDGPDGRLRGQARLGKSWHHLSLEGEALDPAVLDRLVPGSLRGGRLSGRAEVSGTPREFVEQASGTLDLGDTVWLGDLSSDPWLEVVPVTRARASYAFDHGKVELSNATLESPSGNLQGRVRVAEGKHRIRLTVDDAEGALVDRFIPGTVRGGVLRGYVAIDGTPERPLDVSTGRLFVTNARWEPPSDAPFRTGPLKVRWASASYDASGDSVVLRDVNIDTDVLSATGTIRCAPDVTHARMKLKTRSAQRVVDAWPEIAGLLQGGRGSADLDGTWTPAGGSGTLRGRIHGGKLVVSTEGDEDSAHPIETASFNYDFTPRWNRLRHVQMRGPELNGSLNVSWFTDGDVRGNGRAWLTGKYTSEVASGFGWALRALGYQRISSAFLLRGTTEDVRMDADIAHGMRWRLLRLGVPEELRKKARGEAPLWRATGPRTQQASARS